VEEDLQESRALGLEKSEVRSWIGWYRHTTLVMLAYAFLVGIRVHDKSHLPKESASASENREKKRDDAEVHKASAQQCPNGNGSSQDSRCDLAANPSAEQVPLSLVPLTTGCPFVTFWLASSFLPPAMQHWCKPGPFGAGNTSIGPALVIPELGRTAG
jgi:hypothetical protein